MADTQYILHMNAKLCSIARQLEHIAEEVYPLRGSVDTFAHVHRAVEQVNKAADGLKYIIPEAAK